MNDVELFTKLLKKTAEFKNPDEKVAYLKVADDLETKTHISKLPMSEGVKSRAT